MKRIPLLVYISVTSLFFSQSTLKVRCIESLNAPDFFYNSFSLNDTIVEYGICTYSPAFYVGIFDTNCVAWETKYGFSGGYDLGNDNNDGSCRPRIEKYFIFRQNNPVQLDSLNELITQKIPSEHAFVIYTPISYDHSLVSSTFLPLAQTLENTWGNAVVDAQMMILFGIQDHPEAYEIDTTIINGEINFETTICPHCSQAEPIASFNSSTTQIDLAFDNEVTFTVTSPNSNFFQWNFGDGTFNDSSHTVTHEYNYVGTYSIELIVFNGDCSDTVSMELEVINSLGLNTLEGNVEFSLFPNPNNGNFQIHLHGEHAGIIKITDVFGRLAQSLELNNKSSDYIISGLNHGVYLVEICLNDGQKSIKRVIIE